MSSGPWRRPVPPITPRTDRPGSDIPSADAGSSALPRTGVLCSGRALPACRCPPFRFAARRQDPDLEPVPSLPETCPPEILLPDRAPISFLLPVRQKLSQRGMHGSPPCISSLFFMCLLRLMTGKEAYVRFFLHSGLSKGRECVKIKRLLQDKKGRMQSVLNGGRNEREYCEEK